MRINTNVSSLNAQANGTITNKNLSSSLEKLSSGLRINKAADDASGMAIADKLRTQASSLGQGISNANSGSALITIADKAMGEQSNILDTVKTKLIQAATSTTSAEGREAIRKDVQKLLQQLDNISEQTNYNGVNLLDKKGAEFSFQVGEDSSFDIGLKTAYSVNTQGLGSADRDFANSAVITADDGGTITGLALEGEVDNVKMEIYNSASGLTVTTADSHGATFEMDAENATGLTLAINTILRTDDAETIAFLNREAATTGGELKKIADGVYTSTSGTAKTFENNAIFSFHDVQITAGTTGGAVATVFAGSEKGSVEKLSGTSDLALGGITRAVIDGDSADGVAFGDQIMVTEGAMAIRADAPATNKTVAINTVVAATAGDVAELSITIGSSEKVKSLSLWADAKMGSLVTLSTTDGATADALESAGLTKSANGTYQWTAGSASSSKLSFGADGIDISNLKIDGLTKNTTGAERIYVETAGAVTIENNLDATGNNKLQNGVAVQVSSLDADGNASGGALATAFGASAVSSGLGSSNLSGLMAIGEGKLTAETANNFMSVVDDAMTQLNTVRSDFGSTQNQLEVATRNMMVTQVNIKAAESIIRDVDYAAESANFNKQNIIAQAGTYAMSQANAMQQSVTRLLQ
jgi:flagellin